MKADVGSLSAREREALMLLGRGHEAKSIASTLGVSVHAVNERLRAARRKLGVSSSREAARLLLANEATGSPHDNLGYKKFGIDGARADLFRPAHAHFRATGAKRRLIWITCGGVMIALSIAILIGTSGGSGEGSTSRHLGMPEPINPIPSLFAVSDYPAEAVARHAQGITDFRLRIDEIGRVEKCDIERSSGSAALDQATCRVITRRARFRPATDASGRPVKSVYPGMVHWTY